LDFTASSNALLQQAESLASNANSHANGNWVEHHKLQNGGQG
jgi:hypothetical protein